MAALDTVGDYVTEARTMLQDLVNVPVSGYRYTDARLIALLNLAMAEAYRIRADLFLSGAQFTLPFFMALTDTVTMEPGYRAAFTDYMVGRAQLSDAEDTTDSRAAALLQLFKQQLLITTS